MNFLSILVAFLWMLFFVQAFEWAQVDEDAIDNDMSISLYISFSIVVLILSRDINMSFLIKQLIDVDIFAFIESHCQDSFVVKSNILYTMNQVIDYIFQSFNISRALQIEEQLDLSISKQDSSQSHQWSCDKFVSRYTYEIAKECLNALNFSCFRL